MNDVAGIVLAGRHRWDVSDFDELRPRPLMPVGHSPLICHVLSWLRESGITRATICGNSDSGRIRQRLGDGAALGVDLSYFEDWTPRGPAGSIRDAAECRSADRMVVANGTLLPAGCDLGAVLEWHARAGVAMTVVVAGECEGSDEADDRFVPVGIYVLERSVLEHIPETGYSDVKEMLLPRLYQLGVSVLPYTLSTPCLHLTDAASYLTLNAWALGQLVLETRVLPGYRLIGGSLVHESVQIPSADKLVGPVLIGAGSVIEPEAAIIGPTTIGAECIIEARAVICRSVLWDHCHIGRNATVDHYVLGDGVQVEEGARLFHTEWVHEPDHCYHLSQALQHGMFAGHCTSETGGDREAGETESRTDARQPIQVGKVL